MTTVDETTGPVLVTGSSGTTGSRVVEALRAQAPSAAIRRAGRRPGGPGTVRFDWHDSATHDGALRGVERAYLVPPVGEVDPARVMVPFLRRAREHGVRRVVLLGAAAIETGGPGVGEVAAVLPGLVEEAVVVRPSWFMQNLVGDHQQARGLRERGEVVTATGDGRVPFVDADDIAAVAAVALLRPEPLAGELLVTGPEALTYDDVAAEISRVSGRTVTHRRVSAEQLAREVFGDLPDGFATVLADLDAAIAEGAHATVSDDVRRITGRAPRSFADFADRHRAAWTAWTAGAPGVSA